MSLVEDLVPGNAGRLGCPFGTLEAMVSSDELEFPTLKKDVQQVENDQTITAPSSISRSTKERNDRIRLAREIKASTADRK